MDKYFVDLDIENDFYHCPIDVHHRSICFFANELNGECEGLRFYNDGLTLKEGYEKGVFISDWVTSQEFNVITASWNCKTYGGKVEVFASCNGEEWFSWGIWSSKRGVPSSKSTKATTGSIDIDILTFNEKHTRFKYKIEITMGEKSPVVFSVNFALNTENGRLPKTECLKVQNHVPVKRQGTVDVIGGRICSPTSICMEMDYMGVAVPLEDVAYDVFDNGNEIFGNWSYNASYPGEKGLNSFVDFYDGDSLKYALSKGVAVACSIKVSEGQWTKSGYPERKTNGHLLVVTGYITKNGDDWLYINDPAAENGKITVLLSEFLPTWRYGACYIVQQRPERFVTYISHGTSEEMPVIADYVDKDRINRRYERGNVGAKYVVIHNTDNWREGAGAKAHSQYLKGFKEGDRPLAWHYTVDDEAIYKSLPEEEAAYHAGDGGEGEGNLYGIGIEICLNKQPRGEKPSKAFIKAVKNTAILAAELMKKYDLPIENVRQHNAFSGKNCPSCMRENDMWDDFINDVLTHYNKIDSTLL